MQELEPDSRAGHRPWLCQPKNGRLRELSSEVFARAATPERRMPIKIVPARAISTSTDRRKSARDDAHLEDRDTPYRSPALSSLRKGQNKMIPKRPVLSIELTLNSIFAFSGPPGPRCPAAGTAHPGARALRCLCQVPSESVLSIGLYKRNHTQGARS